jgi:oligoendopeptidase F
MRKFVAAEFVADSFEKIEPLLVALEGREIGSAAELEKWLLDCSELAAVVSEVGAKRYIEMTCHTDDPAREKAYLQWIEEISPGLKPHYQKLDEKFLASPYRKELPESRYEVFDRNTANDVALFREENIPLQTEEAKLDQQYNKISGAMTVYFDGALRTMPQMARYAEEQDRRLRQFAWEAATTRRLVHEAEFDELLDKQIAVRDRMAKNAGLKDYVEYAFKMYRRFDYTPAECRGFHDAVAETCVPLVKKMHARRRERMKLDKLRPWDTSVDPLNRAPLRPFSTAEELADKTVGIMGKVDRELAEELAALRDRKLLDLDSRPGKAPGGYQSTLDEQRVPFIFMNAAGMHGDLQTLLHEAGHAFHANAARNDPLLAYRSAPIEFCEVASMGMELLAGPALGEVYGPEEHARALRQHYEGIVGLLPWIAQIDAFQHWIYTHPGHTHAERNAHWMELNRRFGGLVDYSGYEHVHETTWQRQRHLWGSPFYYIEYGIAQLGALQLWANSLKDGAGALAAYKRGLALGGSRPLPELFEATGLRFDFGAGTVGPLMKLLGERLEALPE